MKLFKKSIVPFTILSVFAPLTCLADCPPPSDITITKNTDGTYTVTPPAGYQYGGASYPISATGPIELASVQLISASPPNFNNVSVIETMCNYGINGSSGIYPGGGIFIYNKDQFTTSLDSKNWKYDNKKSYLCFAGESNCSFTKN
jgi:hypothetical protein